MHLNQISKDFVQITDKAESWESAVKLCFEPLLKNGYITEHYIDAVISKAKELNFYFLIAPHLGMPHARPEEGVLKTGISILIVKDGVKFEDHRNNPVYVLIGLAAADSSSHIDVLTDISELFGGDEDIIQELKTASTKEEVIKLLNK